MQLSKQQRYLSSFPRQTIQHHSNPHLCPHHWCQRSWSSMVLWRPTTSSRTNTHTHTKRDILFIIGDWNAKAGSREIPGITDKFGLGVQNEAGQRLTEFCEENKLVIANTIFPTTQEMILHMDISRCQYWNQTGYVLCSQRWRDSIQSAKTRLGADWLRSWGLNRGK